MALGDVLGDVLGGRFEIEQAIRSGGMGEVFRALDRFSNQLVAVKLISGTQDDQTERFLREIELLAELSHPGIVRYVSHGATPSGRLFLVMEWLEGEDLKIRLERTSLTMSESVALATRVAEALRAAHARGIVHRDLKPSNLFLPGGQIDQVKVLDFGIAYQQGRAQLTQTGMVIGTPGYMAPEQARSRGVIDARVDVFALGCVLFHCLTGTRPFEGESATAVLGKILFGDVPRVSALWPEVPDDLDALLARMLARDPALRPSDGADLAAALAALGPEVHSAAIVPRARPRPSALTGSERRLLSVVLLGGSADEDTLADEPLRHAIQPYSGRVEQLANGSTIVVLESDHQVATDQAAQAARCALAIRAVVHGRPMAIAMGRAESSSRLTPRLTSMLPDDDVLDRASRLLANSARVPGAQPPIALDDMSAGLLDARFDVTETDTGVMLCGERALLQGARTLLGRPTSCVGRDWELGVLTGILDECADEPEARGVVVIAAAGMGKSRLGAEFISRVQRRSDDVAIWIGRGDSLRAGSTLDLLAQALRGVCGIHGGEPLAERHDKLRARVAEHVPAAKQKRVTEFLGELIGAPFPADDDGGTSLRAARQDAQLMSEQMRKAWMDFLHAETAVHPVLLVLEDLHWGDFGTVRFIDMALRDCAERPWMVLALARPEVLEVFPRLWAERQNVQEIRLKELGRKAGERLVRQVLGESVALDTMDRLVKQSGGNTFYLEELIRAAAEGKDHELPATVLAMVETRLGRLAVEARRVLRAASVFGEVCWEASVALLVGSAMGPATVGEWLDKLVEQEVLAVRPEGRFAGQREFAFRHSLFREGAYATLTGEDKRLGHRLAGEWLERNGEEDPMVLAGHFERGGEGAHAAGYYLRASRQALHVADLDATMTRASLGLACAPPHELRIDLLGMRCKASGQGLHLTSEVMPDAEELLRIAPPGSVPWGQAMNAYIEGTMATGRIGELRATTALLRDVEPGPEAAEIPFVSGICVLDSLGHVPEGNALEERFAQIVRSVGDREPILQFWWNINNAFRAPYAHDDPWRALAHSDAIQAIHDATGGELVFLNMQLFRGLNQWFLGAFATAEQVLLGIETADESLGVVSSLRRFGLSWLRADRGMLDEARVLATQLREHGRTHRLPLEEGRGRWVLAEVLRRIGDLDAAERELPPAIEMAVPIERPGVLATHAALRLAQGRADEALAIARDAMSQSQAMGGCGLFRAAFVRLVHAEALHATGAHDAARQAIAAARAHLVAIADRICDPAYKQSFLDSVPENARTRALADAWLGETAQDAAPRPPGE